MPRRTLAERVAALEERMAALLKSTGAHAETDSTDWRRAIGSFPNDELMKQIDAAGHAWREKDRRRARRKPAEQQRAKS
jgi:hypothetical protein